MKETTENDPLQEHVGYWLRFVSNHVSQAFSRKLAAEEISVAEWVVMNGVRFPEGVAPSVIAENAGMTRGAISKIVDRLGAKGLAERIAAQGDRRYQRATLTEAGRMLLPKLKAIADANDFEYFGHLDLDEQQKIIDTMRGIARHKELTKVPID